jgi:uncharacterized protein YukE
MSSPKLTPKERYLREELAEWRQAAEAKAVHDPLPKAKLLKPKADFPSSAGKGFSVDSDKLRKLASSMDRDLSQLQAMLTKLKADGDPGTAGGEGWGTAGSFGGNAGQAHQGIIGLYQKLNEAYDLVISNIQKTAKYYSDADSATASAAQNVGREAAGA